jgi:hypothetical protein
MRCPATASLLQIRHGQRSEPIGEGKTVGSAGDDGAAGYSRLSYDLAHEIEVDAITLRREFGPLGFEKLQLAADVNHEVYLAGAVPPIEETTRAPGPAFTSPQLSENESFPHCARRRRLRQHLFGTDIQ